MKSRRVSILLQVAHWCIQHGRRQLEHSIDQGWDHVASLRIDQLITAEELLDESLTVETTA